MEGILFVKKAVPIPADYRPLYRISQVLLILKLACIGSKSSLLKLHLIHWALTSDENKRVLQKIISKQGNPLLVFWGFDPALNRALQFSVAENLCNLHNGRYILSPKGNAFVKHVMNEDILLEEKEFLKEFGKSLSEKKIVEITKYWSNGIFENKSN